MKLTKISMRKKIDDTCHKEQLKTPRFAFPFKRSWY